MTAHYHGFNGELTVSDVGYAPLLETFLNGGKELGYDSVDFNGANQEGNIRYLLYIFQKKWKKNFFFTQGSGQVK